MHFLIPPVPIHRGFIGDSLRVQTREEEMGGCNLKCSSRSDVTICHIFSHILHIFVSLGADRWWTLALILIRCHIFSRIITYSHIFFTWVCVLVRFSEVIWASEPWFMPFPRCIPRRVGTGRTGRNETGGLYYLSGGLMSQLRNSYSLLYHNLLDCDTKTQTNSLRYSV